MNDRVPREVQELLLVMSASSNGNRVDHIVRDCIAFGTLRRGPQAYLDAIDAVLAQPEVPLTFRNLSADEVRTGLIEVAAALRRNQPWPLPQLRKLEPAPCREFLFVIGRWSVGWVTAQHRLGQLFDAVDLDGAPVRVLLLELRTGEQICLVDRQDPTSRSIEIRQRDADGAPTSLSHFRELLSRHVDEITAAW